VLTTLFAFIQVGRPAMDVARHFIERWNFIKKEKAEDREFYPALIAKSDRQMDRENPPCKRKYVYFDTPYETDPYNGNNIVQILRSSCDWSHGLDHVEVSKNRACVRRHILLNRTSAASCFLLLAFYYECIHRMHSECKTFHLHRKPVLW
jgi:hypothetical protein